MRVLFWTPPWIPHGDPLFFRNCFRKNVITQANLIHSYGWNVDLVVPAFFAAEASAVRNGIRRIELPAGASREMVGNPRDPSPELYARSDVELESRIRQALSRVLDSDYDIVLLWETPAAFLEDMFPDALVINQMPGAFSRAPYPHTVTFDPCGLYRQGVLYLDGANIVRTTPSEEARQIVARFRERAHHGIVAVNPFSRADLDEGKFSRLALLPLQVSAHYGFQRDTPYANQMDYLLDVMSKVSSETGVVVTQYITPRNYDTIMTDEVAAALHEQWPNLIYRRGFDKLSTVSQFLAPLVDGVITCSSSIGLQALAWEKELEVPHDTFLRPFASSGIVDRGAWSEQCENVLAFLLTKYQPLASAVLQDGEFLTRLLEEMLAKKRAGKRGMELLSDFTEIDARYGEKLVGGFNFRQAFRELGNVEAKWVTSGTDVEKLEAALANPQLEAISFDVFDTLLRRNVTRPADVFRLMEPAVLRLTGGISVDFALARTAVEKEVRAKHPFREITLDEIYAGIRAYYALDEETTNALKEEEIATERRVMAARPIGKRLWNVALGTGLPLYLISDMYLPTSVVDTLLKDAGYEGYRKSFVSSAYGARKQDGKLFDVVLSDLQIEPERLLHVGDNKLCDEERPRSRGVRTLRIGRAGSRMRDNAAYAKLYSEQDCSRDLTVSVVAAQTANRLFDSDGTKIGRTSLFGGNPTLLGYAALGPMLTGYVTWLGRQAKRDGVSQLYFMSREGWLLKEMYDAVHAGHHAPRSIYLYASRRATRVAGLRELGDVLALANLPLGRKIGLGQLLSARFGLLPSEVNLETVRNAGFNSLDDQMSPELELRGRFLKLSTLLAPHILEVASRERDAYLTYLSQVGLLTADRPAVVDIGWKANIQGGLGKVIGRPLAGYYYCTLQGAEQWVLQGHDISSYCGEMLSHGHKFTGTAHRQLLEYLTCHIEPTLLKFRLEGTRAAPVLAQEDSWGKRKTLIRDVHRGAIEFAADFAASFGDVRDQIWLDPFLGERVFACFCSSPASVDARMLEGHHFEDAVGGWLQRYLIHPGSANAKKTGSVWMKGAEACITDNKGSWFSDARSKAGRRASRFVVPSWVLSAEAKAVEAIVSERKVRKYRTDRVRFFADSRSKYAKLWLSLTSQGT